MHGKRDEPEREDQPCTSSPSSDCDQRQGKRVEQREHRLGALTEEQRRRLDADERVVVAILVRVDSVIADHPAYGAGVEQNRRCIETPKGRRPSHQRAPGEGEPEHNLRPVGDPLHERIDRDHRQRGEADEDREPVELQQNRKPEQCLQREKAGGGRDRHLSRRDGARARALNARIEVAIDDIVPGAARPAHGKRADEEQEQMPEVDPHPGVNRGKANRPPARQQQQPRADRAVEARQAQIGAEPYGGPAVDPVAG